MKTDSLWMVHYKDDTTFNERLHEAVNKLHRYAIVRTDAAKELLTDLSIQCGERQNIIPDKDREIQDYLVIQFPIFSKSDETYRK